MAARAAIAGNVRGMRGRRGSREMSAGGRRWSGNDVRSQDKGDLLGQRLDLDGRAVPEGAASCSLGRRAMRNEVSRELGPEPVTPLPRRGEEASRELEPVGLSGPSLPVPTTHLGAGRRAGHLPEVAAPAEPEELGADDAGGLAMGLWLVRKQGAGLQSLATNLRHDRNL